MNYSFDNITKLYYKRHDLGYYDKRIFNIESCQCIRDFTYNEPSITIRGTLDPEKYNDFMYKMSGWNRNISKKYLRLFS